MMIIKKHKKSDNILLYIFVIIYLSSSCSIQKEIKNHRIIKGFLVEDFQNYIFSDDTNSLYFTGKDTISVRSISEYDEVGNLSTYSIYKPEGVLEYSIDDLMKDTLLFQSAGVENKKWKFISNNKISNNRDTLVVETIRNNLGANILINRKGNIITIFESSITQK